MSTVERKDRLKSRSGVNLIDRAVLGALVSMSCTDEPLTPTTVLAEVDIDSLDLIELTQLLEEQRAARIPPNAFTEVVTVGDVINVVRSHVA